VLKLTGETADAPSEAPAAAVAVAKNSDTAALTVGIIGLVVGVLGVALAGLAFARTRRPAA
jgi:hypothetical protein